MISDLTLAPLKLRHLCKSQEDFRASVESFNVRVFPLDVQSMSDLSLTSLQRHSITKM